MKFEIGDKVTLNDRGRNGYDPDEIIYISRMDKYIGKKMTIEYCLGGGSTDKIFYNLKECRRYNYSEYWLETWVEEDFLKEELFLI